MPPTYRSSARLSPPTDQRNTAADSAAKKNDQLNSANSMNDPRPYKRHLKPQIELTSCGIYSVDNLLDRGHTTRGTLCSLRNTK